MDDGAAAVRSVWADNFKAESAVFCQIAPHATHVALNVQYPGCVIRGDGRKSHYDMTAEERYQVIHANVSLLKPLQVGLAIRTDDGGRFAWEFNLRGFDVASDLDARDPDSIAYLARRGVDLASRVRAQASWATFAGAYHVGYFAAMMSGEKLPDDVDDFMEMVRQLLGPAVYDVKRLARQHDQRCVGALGHIVKQLGVVQPNEPKPTPAGTGSTLALLAFETLKEKLGANAEKYRGQLCGLQAV
ncbi:probable CCR4-associated factor 1 homolog 9 [Aegilops tauschii subsp. strangulata]|uniref:probable CCR4-associated factor 1 homolog 9 n=1 Tax=Aegilops tauschii subsp. strangulata TaxID=200361 RepID=UPI000989F0A3|nr:probable CCR4-associated factor 1 homolog 9 [Aegilops tauschii subsp. strangulata]